MKNIFKFSLISLFLLSLPVAGYSNELAWDKIPDRKILAQAIVKIAGGKKSLFQQNYFSVKPGTPITFQYEKVLRVSLPLFTQVSFSLQSDSGRTYIAQCRLDHMYLGEDDKPPTEIEPHYVSLKFCGLINPETHALVLPRIFKRNRDSESVYAEGVVYADKSRSCIVPPPSNVFF